METELIAMGATSPVTPRLGFEETRTVKIETDYLRAHGFLH